MKFNTNLMLVVENITHIQITLILLNLKEIYKYWDSDEIDRMHSKLVVCKG